MSRKRNSKNADAEVIANYGASCSVPVQYKESSLSPKLHSLFSQRHRQRQEQEQPSRGWWIRSLHTRFNFGDDLDVFVSTITSILQHCPNLTTFMHVHDFNGPLPTRVITALTENCGHTLLRFQLDWGGVDIDDLIRLLETSPVLQHLAPVAHSFAERVDGRDRSRCC